MSASLNVNLAWAVPVRPDLLGARLEAFTKVLPALRTLRLSKRFGRGPKAYITKLPAEILLQIEEEIVGSVLTSCLDTWTSPFKCFERRCSIIDHEGEGDFEWPLWADGLSDAGEPDPCVACGEHGLGTAACERICDEKASDKDKCAACVSEYEGETCMESCQGQRDRAAEALICEMSGYRDSLEDVHHDRENEWQCRASSTGIGRYQKILREQFGLEVVLDHTRKADGSQELLHRNQRHESYFPLQTTLCHLTLPGMVRPPSLNFSTSESEDTDDFIAIEIATTLSVNPSALILQDKKRNRFRRALKLLDLKPFVHASQRENVTSDIVANKADNSNSGTKQWPKLLVLANGQSYYDRETV